MGKQGVQQNANDIPSRALTDSRHLARHGHDARWRHCNTGTRILILRRLACEHSGTFRDFIGGDDTAEAAGALLSRLDRFSWPSHTGPWASSRES
jgi:hypothetical protein